MSAMMSETLDAQRRAMDHSVSSHATSSDLIDQAMDEQTNLRHWYHQLGYAVTPTASTRAVHGFGQDDPSKNWAVKMRADGKIEFFDAKLGADFDIYEGGRRKASWSLRNTRLFFVKRLARFIPAYSDRFPNMQMCQSHHANLKCGFRNCRYMHNCPLCGEDHKLVVAHPDHDGEPIEAPTARKVSFQRE